MAAQSQYTRVAAIGDWGGVMEGSRSPSPEMRTLKVNVNSGALTGFRNYCSTSVA